MRAYALIAHFMLLAVFAVDCLESSKFVPNIYRLAGFLQNPNRLAQIKMVFAARFQKLCSAQGPADGAPLANAEQQWILT